MNLRNRPLGWGLTLTLLVCLTLTPSFAWSARYVSDALEGDIIVELSHGVTLRFDGATQLRLETAKRLLAQVELRIAPADPDDGARSRPGPIESQIHHWGYYHVDGVAFWYAHAEGPGRPVLASVDDLPWQLERQNVRPHVSVGRAKVRSLELYTRRVQADDGPLYVGWLRLDGATAADPTASDFEVQWDGSCDWPLAFLVARTQEELLFQAGQAEWTYDQVSRDGERHWTAPPLCAHCRNPEIGLLRLQLKEEGGTLRLHAVFEQTPEPRLVSAEGLTVLGRRLGEALVSEGESGATYDLALDDPWVGDLLDAARLDQVEASVSMATGLRVEPRQVEIQIDPSLRRVEERSDEGAEIRAEGEQTKLPGHLSPRLVQSWPNPFRDHTTIEVTVPATMEEAFELDEELRRQVDVKAAPPFGGSPVVRVRVYNVGGQLVQLLSEEVHGPGRFAVSWDGQDLQGRPVAAGAYYVNVEMGDWTVTKRVLRLKP